MAVVTGAGRGIGADTACRMAEAGARVALVDRDGAGLTQTAERIGITGADCLFFQEDVADAFSVERSFDQIAKEWGRLDILVNNAGIVSDAQIGDVNDADWHATLEVNLHGTMICTRAAVPHMLANGHGRVLSASSVVALDGNFGQTSYGASKAGVIGMTRVWARELGPKGITANAVAPGFIDTEMVKSVPQKVIDRIIRRVPAGRMGTPDEVAWVYLFLASDLASYVNGAVVGVDGGILL